MSTGRAWHRTLPLIASALLLGGAGCSQQAPFLARRTTMGELKSSVVQLETENSKLRTKLANAESEARRVEDDLVKVESINGELTARLDDARDYINQGKTDVGSTTQTGRSDSDDFSAPARPVRSRVRKPPIANIKARSNSDDEDLDDSFGPPDDIPPIDRPRSKATPTRKERVEDDGGWLPIARPIR